MRSNVTEGDQVSMQTSPELRNVVLSVPPHVSSLLIDLPWGEALDTWDRHGVRFLKVKSGMSRHVVRFVEIGEHRFAIKETSLESAQREHQTYVRLHEQALPTLRPVGYVMRSDGTEIIETPVGGQVYDRFTGFLVTELMEKVIPDAYLFRRGFSKANRQRIWEAVIHLFVAMHSRGVYWGDASLANMLIHFSAIPVPELGHRTRLRAVLADVETVEIHDSLTDSLRLADIEFFIESMHWTEADLKASGVVRASVITADDERHILETYKERYSIEQEMRSFELVTNIDVDKLLGDFDVKGYAKLLLKHINEHKWYVSERSKREASLQEAAEDWYNEIFRPVCKVFLQHKFAEYFPDRTAASLYIEIMEHKYLMSEQAGKDVGLVEAARDFVKRFAVQKPDQPTIRSILSELRALLKRLPVNLQAVYPP